MDCLLSSMFGRKYEFLFRRLDRCPGKHSRVCSCHFRDGDKSNGPEMFTRNASKPFPPDDYSTKGRKTKKRKIEENEKDSVHNLVERLKPKEDSEEIKQNKKVPVTEIVLRAKLRE